MDGTRDIPDCRPMLCADKRTRAGSVAGRQVRGHAYDDEHCANRCSNPSAAQPGALSALASVARFIHRLHLPYRLVTSYGSRRASPTHRSAALSNNPSPPPLLS